MLRKWSAVMRVQVVMLACLVFPACRSSDDAAVQWELEREGIELTQQLKLAEYRLGLSASGDMAELGRLEGRVRESGDQLKFLQQKRTSLAAEVEAMTERNAEFFRTAIRQQREKSLALRFESFSVRDGRTFTNVSVTNVDDAGVAIRHEHGAAKLRYADLTREQCVLFGLEEEAALIAEERERQEAIAYEQSIEEEMAVLRDQEERTAAIAKNDVPPRSARLLSAATSSGNAERPLSKAATPFGTGSIWRNNYSGYRSYRPTYRYVYYYPSTRNPYCTPRTYRSVVDNRIVYPR